MKAAWGGEESKKWKEHVISLLAQAAASPAPKLPIPLEAILEMLKLLDEAEELTEKMPQEFRQEMWLVIAKASGLLTIFTHEFMKAEKDSV